MLALLRIASSIARRNSTGSAAAGLETRAISRERRSKRRSFANMARNSNSSPGSAGGAEAKSAECAQQWNRYPVPAVRSGLCSGDVRSPLALAGGEDLVEHLRGDIASAHDRDRGAVG